VLLDVLQRGGTEAYRWTAAPDQLVDQYFEGECPLLGEAEETLLDMVEHAENLVAHFNDHIELAGRTATKKRKPALPKPIDLEAMQETAQPSADELVRTLVDMAQAEACDMMGEKKQALAFAERGL